MSSNLNLQLSINIKPFSDALKAALSIGERFGKQIDGVLAGKIIADTSEFDADLKKAVDSVGGIPDKEVVIGADGTGVEEGADKANDAIGGIPDEKETSLGADPSGAENGADKANDAIGGIPDEKNTSIGADASSALSVISQLSMAYQGLQTAIDRVLDGVKKVFSPVYDFGQTMAQLKAISGATTEEMRLLSEQSKELGASTEYSASEVGSLQVEFSKLGFTASEINKVTEGVLDLATASGESLKESATIAGSTLRGFGLDVAETGRVTDVMAKSFSTSALDLFKFKESMKMVAPASKAVGFEIEETTAMLGKLADAGIHGSLAGTGLKRVLGEMKNENSKLSQVLGGTAGSFEEFVELLEKAKERGQEFNDEAMKELSPLLQTTVLTLVGASDQLGVYEGQLKKASGASKEMADIQRDTLKGAIDEFNSALEGTLIALGEKLEPALVAIIDLGAKFFTVLTKNKEIILGVIGAISTFVIVTKGLKLAQMAYNIALAIGKGLMGDWKALIIATVAGMGIYALQAKLTADAERVLGVEVGETNKTLEDRLEIYSKIDNISGGNLVSQLRKVNDELNMFLNERGADRDTTLFVGWSDEDLAILNTMYDKRAKLIDMRESELQAKLLKRQKEIEEEGSVETKINVDYDFGEPEEDEFELPVMDGVVPASLLDGSVEKMQHDLDEKNAIQRNYYGVKRQYFEEFHQFQSSGLNAMLSGYQAFGNSLLDTDMTGKERREKVWDSIKKSFLSSVISMTSEYIKQKMIEHVFTVGIEEKNVAVVAGSHLKQVAISVASGLKKVAISLYEIGAKIFGFFAGLGPFGIPLALGTIGTIAGLISGFKGFASGGWTGDGASSEPAGVVHKGEIVFEAPLVSKNKKTLLGLRELMQKGASLSDIIMPTVRIPSPVIAGNGGASYANGGYVSGGQSGYNFENLERKFDALIQEVRRSESKTVVNVQNRSRVNVHRENMQAQRAYEKRMNND